MEQHTQGPWIVSLDPRYPNEPCIDAVIDGVVWHIALCHNAVGPDDTSVEANARLIAAAPELLASLKDALPLLRADRSRYEAALSVLAKIDGTTPYARTAAARNLAREPEERSTPAVRQRASAILGASSRKGGTR